VAKIIQRLVVHCSASPNGQPVGIADIDRWHATRGFKRMSAFVAKFNPQLKHVGYHFVIALDGTVETGRAQDEIGAHVAGHNTGSLGICMVGTDQFTPAQWSALKTLISNLKGNYPAARVMGHRDFSPDKNGDGKITPNEFIKLCPCFDVMPWYAGGMLAPAANVLG
jgi:N-acetyl-anhydromuramyl-L-alanine amidase AmpD